MSARSAALGLSLLLLWLAATMAWWALAFPPLPQGGAPPEWLARLQSVCFGSAPGGGPAGYGWGMLAAGPLGMLGVMLAGWGNEVRAGLHGLASRPAGRIVLGVLAVAVAVEVGWIGWRANALNRGAAVPAARQQAMPADYARLNRPAPPLRLTDQDGRTVALADYRGRVVLLTFAYGHCTMVCPTIVANVGSALRQRPESALDALVVSMDPWRDRPGGLAALAERWNAPANLRVLSGDVPRVLHVLDAYDVAMRRDEDTGEIDHAALVYVIDPQGRIAYALLNPSPRWLLEAARRARRAT